MPWADTDEFTDFLQAAGLLSDPLTSVQSLLDLQGALDAAEAAWNDLTGYWPFLSNGQLHEARKFTPHLSPILDFDSGLLTLTSFAANVQYTNNASDGGDVRTQSTDFFLRPSDAPQKNKPWTYAEIACGVWGMATDSVVVTGEWGYCRDSNLPADARRAHMMLAAQFLMPQIQMYLRRGGLVKLQEGDSTKQWSDKLEEQGNFWQMQAEMTAKRYRRLRYG